MKEVPKMKAITIAMVSERLKVSGSLARRALRILEAEGKITPLIKHGDMMIYTRA